MNTETAVSAAVKAGTSRSPGSAKVKGHFRAAPFCHKLSVGGGREGWEILQCLQMPSRKFIPVSRQRDLRSRTWPAARFQSRLPDSHWGSATHWLCVPAAYFSLRLLSL